jgi:MFS family permease
MLGHFGAMLMLAFATNPLLIGVAAFVHGVAWGTRGPLMIAMRADFYGRRHFGKIIGTSNVVVMLGPFVGPWLAGRLNDHYGNYDLAFTTVGLMVGVSSLFFFLARTPPPPSRKSQ